MKKLLFALALLFSIPAFAMVEKVPPQYPTVSKPTFFQKLALKKVLKKVDPTDKKKLTNGEMIASIISLVFLILGLVIKTPAIAITFLLLSLIFDIWLIFQLLKKL